MPHAPLHRPIIGQPGTEANIFVLLAGDVNPTKCTITNGVKWTPAMAATVLRPELNLDVSVVRGRPCGVVSERHQERQGQAALGLRGFFSV